MNKIIGFLLLALLLSISPVCDAEKPKFPVGPWELCDDPDGGKKDIMEFDQAGSVKVVRQTGRISTGEYSIENDTITLVFLVRGNTITIPLTVSADQKKIFAYSEGTKNTSYYARLGNPEKFACTAE